MTSRMAYNPLPFVLSVEGLKPKLAPPLSQSHTIMGQAGYAGIRSGQPTVLESARLTAQLLRPRLEMRRAA